MEEDSPFWLQPSSAAIRRRGRTSSSSSSPILLVILLVVAAASSLALVVLVLPSFHSYSTTLKTPHPKPSPQKHSIKKGWDYLNLVLVLFAVICGFLSRTGGSRNDNAGSGQTASRTSSPKSNVTPRTPYRSYYYDHGGGGYSEENRYGGFSSPSTSFNSRIATMRNSFSYPDLRQESAWSSYDFDRRRFYDDTSIDRRGFVDSEQIYGGSGSRRWRDDVDVDEVKSVVEDAAAAAGVGTKEGEQVKGVEPPQPQSESLLPSPSTPSPPPPPPPPPALPAIEGRRKHRRKMSYEAIPRVWKDDDFGDNVWERPPSTPPPPPPPPPVVYWRNSSEEKNSNRNGKKRGGSASATKEFFQSLGKKKKQRQKSIENFEALLGHPSSSDRHRLTLSPPPPSPPPPTHSVLQNLFSSKKSRNRNRNRKTAPHSSPPPSPPPRRTSDISKSKRPRNPELSSTVIEEGNRSPLIPIPPAPPPPPPFKVPEWKFTVVHRDYVRIKSTEPLRLNSPDITEYEGENENEDDQISEGSLMSSPMSSRTTTPNVKGGDGAMFCQSPDVDTKADKFIARFREGLKLEKMDSWNQRQGTNVRSNLGPPIDH